MRPDPVTAATGVLVLVAASASARYLKRRMDDSTGLEVVGFALSLMVANILQLVGLVVTLAGFFGDR